MDHKKEPFGTVYNIEHNRVAVVCPLNQHEYRLRVLVDCEDKSEAPLHRPYFPSMDAFLWPQIVTKLVMYCDHGIDGFMTECRRRGLARGVEVEYRAFDKSKLPEAAG